MGILTVAAVAKSQHGEPGWMSAKEWFWLQEAIDKGNKKRAKEQDERQQTASTHAKIQ